MKKSIFVVALCVAGLMNAKNFGKAEKNRRMDDEKFYLQKTKFFYNPVKITSSCGYTEYIDYNPGFDDPDCIYVEADRMEDECYAPVTGSGYAYNGYS